MKVFLYIIAPNIKRETEAVLGDLVTMAATNDHTPEPTELQSKLWAYFNSQDDVIEASQLLALGESYKGCDESGEYSVGISTISMDHAKLQALEQLIIDMEMAEADGPTHF